MGSDVDVQAVSRSSRPKSRKRPRRYHHDRRSEHRFSRLLRTLPTTEAEAPEWGEPEPLHRKTQKPKRRRAG